MSFVEFRDKLIMLDCGMYQGKDKDFNYKGHEVSPENIDYLLLSHSHIDHSGRIHCLSKTVLKEQFTAQNLPMIYVK